MFKKIFGKEEEDDFFETVDPVLEQRRKEKFSTPLIYSDDDEVEEVKQEKKKEKVVPKKSIPVESAYVMSEIISPISGVKESKSTPKKIAKPKKKTIKKESDHLIPVISPFYGPADNMNEEEEFVQEEVVNVEENKTLQENKTVKVEEPSVQEHLRDIANIVKEEQDQLKIIEERTGEFKLDFQSQEEPTLIDEIDDSMSLDELMSLYEKKFRD